MIPETTEPDPEAASPEPQVTVRKLSKPPPPALKEKPAPATNEEPASVTNYGGKCIGKASKPQADGVDSSMQQSPQEPADSSPLERAQGSVFFSAASKSWWVRGANSFVPMDRILILKELISLGLNPEKNGESLSEVDRFLIETNKNPVNYSGPLAGHPAGIIVGPNERILVTEPCHVMEAQEGSCQIILRWLEELTGDDPRQFQTLLYWLHLRRKALLTSTWRPGQLLVLAGPAGCGKSFLQGQIITPLLGGRIVRPYRYMAGGTDFNADLFSAEHLSIEDESPSRDLQSRRRLGSQIKSMLFSKVQSCHPKGRTPIHLAPIWAMTLSVNEEPENLMVLPPLDESLADKIIILKCRKPTPPTYPAPDEMHALIAMVNNELPALAYYLDQLGIPPEFAEPRTGLRSFHNGEILEALNGLSPEAKLDQIITASILQSSTSWRGKALELETILTRSDSPWRHEAQRLFHFNTACGVYLARLAASMPDRYRKKTIRGDGIWEIGPELSKIPDSPTDEPWPF